MAFALLYYRTDGEISWEADTRKGASGSTYDDPTDLPAGQKLEFDFPDNILERKWNEEFNSYNKRCI